LVLGEFVDDKLLSRMDEEIEKESQSYVSRVNEEI